MKHRFCTHLILLVISFSLANGFLPTEVCAQPVRFLEAYEDNDESIQSNIGQILSDTLNIQPDSLLRQLPVIMAYHRWAQMARIEWSTPLVKRLEIWRRKAQANFLIGMYQAYLIPKYSRIESGALPLAQQSKSFLDSASVNYNQLLRHVVDQSKFNLKLDSAITSSLSGELDSALKTIEKQGYIQPLQKFNPDSIVKAEFILYKKNKLPVQNALGWWFANALAADSADIKKHDLKNPNVLDTEQ